MKSIQKWLCVICTTLLVIPTWAADNFTGVSIGLDMETTKYSNQEALKAKNTGAVVLKGAYGLDYGNNWVAQIEASANLNTTKAYQEANSQFFPIKVKEKNKFSLGYVQGYRVTSDLMPYVKAQYISNKMVFGVTDVSNAYSKRYSGFGVGVGAKYAIYNNIEFGAEYVHNRLKKGEEKFNGNTVSAGVAYRFK